MCIRDRTETPQGSSTQVALRRFPAHQWDGVLARRVCLGRRNYRRLTIQWNGKLTQSFVWLRQASSPRQFPLISDVRRRLKEFLVWIREISKNQSSGRGDRMVQVLFNLVWLHSLLYLILSGLALLTTPSQMLPHLDMFCSPLRF